MKNFSLIHAIAMTRNCVLLMVMAFTLSACGLFQPEMEMSPREAQKVVDTAYGQLGKRYRPGGASPQKGFDCSGLIYWVYKKNGYNIPRTTTDQAKCGIFVARKNMREGDILVFRMSDSPRGLHTGIYTGDTCFIHSPSRGKKVKLDTVEKKYWKERLVAIRRVVR